MHETDEEPNNAITLKPKKIKINLDRKHDEAEEENQC